MSSFDIFRKANNPMVESKPAQYNTVEQNKQAIENNLIKGYLLNTKIKNQDNIDTFSSFDYIVQSSPNKQELEKYQELPKTSSFDMKKAIKPVVITALATMGAIIGISSCVKQYSKILAKSKSIVRPPDLPRSMNILEEYHLAMYKFLRDPNGKNALGLAGVGLFSILVLSAKTLVDGIKQVWIKKQNCDIDYDLQNSLIEVERDSFSGKLNTINTLLTDTSNYFKQTLTNKNQNNVEFKNFLSFKGSENNSNDKNKQSNKLLLGIGAVVGFVTLAFALFKNFQKTASNFEEFTQKMTDKEIKEKINKAINLGNKKDAIKALSDILKTINATEARMKENLGKIKGITPNEIDKTISSIKKEQIFAQAPEALGGVSEKIQYYCYINEERGHLYNWILNPENKWNKYLFLSFCFVSSLSYLSKSAADALKQVAVSRENMKSELNLRKRLVAVEVNNFKAKKLSAINPMIDNFNMQKQNGKSKEELTQMAQNILLEIKNGPPYVYN